MELFDKKLVFKMQTVFVHILRMFQIIKVCILYFYLNLFFSPLVFVLYTPFRLHLFYSPLSHRVRQMSVRFENDLRLKLIDMPEFKDRLIEFGNYVAYHIMNYNNKLDINQ